LACENEVNDCIELILENTNEISKDNNGDTALIYAIDNYDESIVHKILKKFPMMINETNNKCQSPLMISIIKNNFTIFRAFKELYLYKYNQFNNKDIDGNTILILSCKIHHLGIESKFIKSILTTDIDINSKNNDGHNALMFLCANKYDNDLNIKLLLDREEILINEINNLGKSALMYACDNCNFKIIKLLLNKSDIDIYHQDNLGNTILINLCSNIANNPFIIVKLIKSKFKIDDIFLLKNKQGKSALDYLKSNKILNQTEKDKILELFGM